MSGLGDGWRRQHVGGGGGGGRHPYAQLCRITVDRVWVGEAERGCEKEEKTSSAFSLCGGTHGK
jgi:hypothetical protein